MPTNGAESIFEKISSRYHFGETCIFLVEIVSLDFDPFGNDP